MEQLNRRQFVALGLSATATAVAGCSRPQDSDSEPYAEWLPARDGGTITAYLDFTLSEETTHINPALPLIVPTTEQDDGNLAPTLPNIDDINDPLVTLPLQTGGRVLGGAALSLAIVGLGRLVDPARPTQGITELFFADGVTIGRGDLDPSTIDTRLRTGPNRTQFETVGTDGDYAMYGLIEGTDGFVAVNETTVVIADARDRVEAVLDTQRGSRAHAGSTGDSFATLLTETDMGHVMVGWDGPIDLSQNTFGDGNGQLAGGLISQEDAVVSSVAFDPDNGEMTADLGLHAAGEVNEATLNERFGAASVEHTVSVDGKHVTASGRYTEETIDVDFVANEDPTTTTTIPREDDLPPKVANAVPENAFEFTVDEAEERVRVEFVSEFNADEVTVKATNSGYESTTTTPDPISYLDVYVNPEDDTVLVIVTVDGVSGVVAQYDIP